MKNLPVKKKIEDLLEQEFDKGGRPYERVFKINGKNKYLKISSLPPLYGVTEKSFKDVLICAKLYQKLIEVGLYHPKTKVMIYKDGKENLSVTLIMPELEIQKYVEYFPYKIQGSINTIEDKLGLEENSLWSGDLKVYFNWGRDKETGKLYFHDLDVKEFFEQFLELAEQMGIK